MGRATNVSFGPGALPIVTWRVGAACRIAARRLPRPNPTLMIAPIFSFMLSAAPIWSKSLSIYDPLHERLSSLHVTTVRMSFTDIEEIIGQDLPPSSRKYPAWWGNNDQGGKRHSSAWLNAGWRTEDLALEMEEVSFVRISEPTPPTIFGAGIATSLTADWVPSGDVKLSQDGKLAFPDVPKEAGVYRFRLSGEEKSRCYIGESANLRGRFGSYRNPGSTQATNLRLNALMLEHLEAGGAIGLDLITQIGALTQGNFKKERSLSDKAVRRLLEQAAIVADDATEIESLNR